MGSRVFGTLVLLFALVVIVLSGCEHATSSTGTKGRQDNVNRPVAVATAEVTRRDVPVYLNGLGNVAAYNTVVVKSRIDGQLLTVNVREGQEVNKGDTLAAIDPRPFQAVLDQTKATLAKDEAALVDAKTNLARFTALVQSQVIAQQQFDTQRSQVGQIEGQIGADKAQVESAQLQLSFTRITAPIPGRIGLRQVDAGNMIHAADASGLFVITQMQPIAVLFALPEDSLTAVIRQSRSGALAVEAYARDNQTKLATGTLKTVNNQIDPTTGTDKLKAVFDNKDRSLWPNEFVNVKLLLDMRKNALTIPVAALQRGSQGTFVYVVKADKTVEARPVKVDITEGGIASIAQGLNTGELVVTDGQDKLQAGSTVALSDEQGSQGAGPTARSGPGT